MNPSLKRLLFLKMMLFLLPILLILGFPAFVLVVSGELIPIDRIVSSGKKDPAFLLGLAYSNQDAYFKLRSTQESRPRTLVLGSSRVVGFREEFFKDRSFFNAGRGATHIEDFERFLSPSGGPAPTLLILGMDQHFFHPQWSTLSEKNDYSRPSIAEPLRILGSQWHKIYRDFLTHKFSIRVLTENFGQKKSKIGMNALFNNSGFRRDGSYLYGDDAARSEIRSGERFKSAFENIKKGDYYFSHAQEPSEAVFENLERFLSKCREQQIHVVGFLPPYAPLVYARLSEGQSYGYMRKLPSRLAPIFKSHGYAFFDFSDIQVLGATDRDFIDGFHGSEGVYHQLLVRMAEQDSILNEKISR